MAEARSSSCWPCKEATPWRILLREQLNICRTLGHLFLFSAAQTAKIAPDYCSNGNTERLAICLEISVLCRFRLPFRTRSYETGRWIFLDVERTSQNCLKIRKPKASLNVKFSSKIKFNPFTKSQKGKRIFITLLWKQFAVMKFYISQSFN